MLKKINLGIAIDTEDGLFAPVLRDVGERDEGDLRNGLEEMKKDTVDRDLPPEKLRGATLTLSNFGVFGAGRFAALVVIPPQVAIIGAGRVAARVVGLEGKPTVRQMLPLSITFDHRVVSGGEAARFLTAVIKYLGQVD